MSNVTADLSPAQLIARELVAQHGLPGAHAALDAFLDAQPIVDLAAHEYDWRGVWARPKQLPPLSDWKSWGFLTGRGFGKTIAVSKFVNEEVEAGRATSICLIAQDEDNAIKLQIEGPSGLIATAPPWFKPEWEASKLVLTWPNGAKAYVRTPEVPEKIRGFDYDLAWLTEIQSWPKATRDAAMMNVKVATRIGLARVVWDATAKRRHPLLRALLKASAEDPTRHVVVSGSTHENADNLADGYIQDIEREIGGTRQGDEELHGNMSTDAEGATAQEAWIERNRRNVAGPLSRRVLSIDPAVTVRSGSDMTGVCEAGLTSDGKVAVLADHTGKHTPGDLARIVLDRYFDGRCDLAIIETNKAGLYPTQNIRAAAESRGVHVVVIGKEERAPGHQHGVIHVREIYSRGEKADRARPLSTAIEKDRVVFVGHFPELEDILTTWEPVPGARSPDRLDALVGAAVELLGLSHNAVDPHAGFVGIKKFSEGLADSRAPSPNLAALLGHGHGSGRI